MGILCSRSGTSLRPVTRICFKLIKKQSYLTQLNLPYYINFNLRVFRNNFPFLSFFLESKINNKSLFDVKESRRKYLSHLPLLII